MSIKPIIEIQCNLNDAFGKYEGEILFVYDENTKTLTPSRSVGKSFVFMDNPNAWIGETIGVGMRDVSQDATNIKTAPFGQWGWEFNLDRRDGTVVLKQRKVQMYWQGDCSKVDRSNRL